MKKILGFLAVIMHLAFYSQDYFPTNSSVKTSNAPFQAIVNATVVLSPGNSIENGTVLFRNGKIIEVGQNVTLPENTVTHDKKGLYVYPSFIDVTTSFGVKAPSRLPSSGRSASYEASRQGYYWNDHILSDFNATSVFSYDNKTAKTLRAHGFGVVNTHRKDGVHRGTSAVVALDDQSSNSFRILNSNAAEQLSFSKSIQYRQSYPSSVMGAMALIRQFYYDLDWYKNGGSDSKDLAIEAAIKNHSLPKIFYAGNKLNVMRAVKISKELGLNSSVVSTGLEFENIAELVQHSPTLIVPVNFPKAYDLTDLNIVEKLTLQQLRRWNQAPSNLSVLEKNNISFAITPQGTKNAKEFMSNIQKAISYGLSENKALEALTIEPAKILNMQGKVGEIKKGAYANFLISSGPLFDSNTIIFENWTLGNSNIVSTGLQASIDGDYAFSHDDSEYLLSIKNSQTKVSSTVTKDSVSLKTKTSLSNGWLNISVVDKKEEAFAFINADTKDKSLNNILFKDFDGNNNQIVLSKKESKSKKKQNAKKPYEPVSVTFPNKAYGFKTKPAQKTTLFKNATVWTGEDAGILKNTDVLVVGGKIQSIGKDLEQEGALIIDATGKHLTAGIVDEHSHIAASSINEGGHNSSAEVSIQDVVDAEDIDIYRNLSGGVTTIQILHGSANPIGGQSAIIKLKWGEKNLLFEDAPGFIKFALGENVKQSNWGSFSRFPQTRMGVEQVFVDYFQRAKEYDSEWKEYNSLPRRERSRTNPPRYDVEMKVLAEILNKERFVSCHSYVASEINMLMKVADRFNFNINTFTHILEGYKVADEMREHGVGGSTFSDWWAYKYEVNDAIPYNGPIMTKAGVTVAYNSDDAEMSRRLNQEAAKAVKYGGLSEEEAWKYVTINPAKLLRIDDKVGSIKEGKHADLTLWNNNPLSVYAVAEKTMIEGIVYYDIEETKNLIKDNSEEKNLLLSMMIEAKERGEETVIPTVTEKRILTCESLD